MKKFFGEFKTFITRGNVIDLAVGVIIGGAFTAIVNGLSNYVLKPIINWVICLIMGGEGFSDAITMLQTAWVVDENGNYVKNAVTGAYEVDLANSIYIDWGSLITTIINFILTALVLFIIVRAINRLKEEKSNDVLTKEDKKELKKLGIKRSNTEAVQKYIADKVEAKEKAEAEAAAAAAEAARLERLANPTTEDLLKEILAELKAKQN